MQEYNESVIEASKEKLVVLDCFATWCGPCKMISPVMVELSNKSDYADAAYIKIDVDESPDVAQELGVRAMPTFYFFKGGQQVDQLVGANPAKLEELIKKHK